VADSLRLKFHHNVVEHLGLRLYHNKPDKVLCELVSNSWDADAAHVWVDLALEPSGIAHSLTVIDDGLGMDRATLQRSFLTIAAPRRTGENAQSRTPNGRLLMGRKGLGKLAPFGICKTVSVITGNAAAGYSWISLNLDGIQQASPNPDADELGQYGPDEILIEGSLDDLLALRHPLAAFRDRYVGKLKMAAATSGTAIILTDISDRLRLSSQNFKSAIASRFTVTLARPDFIVTVDDEAITEDEVLPKFDFRIPSQGWNEDEVGSNKVRYWVGFTSKPLPQAETGIGVFAHGKLAQERPFSFNLKGNDFYIPYTYGAIEADWLDDFSEDLISTDRASLDWSHPQAQLLHEWGVKNLRRWINQFQDERQGRERTENAKAVDAGIASGAMPALTAVERKSLVELLSDVSPRLPPDSDTKSSVASALADAWLHKPARDMIQELWNSIRDQEGGADGFIKSIEAIREWSVPEALSVSVTFAQRAFALTVLYESIHLHKEPDLQRLIEAFPWIVGPETEYLTANQTLKTFVLKAEADGLFARQSDQNLVSETLKPDFVFLTDAKNEEFLVVEIKSPQVELTLSNREQLSNYLTFLEGKYPGSDIQGILIGNAPHGFKIPRDDMLLKSWQEVFTAARSSYTKILGSMLSGYADDPNDPRINDVQVFGGKEVWELLKNVATHDEYLYDLITRHEAGKN
jgi:hypothetical protein